MGIASFILLQGDLVRQENIELHKKMNIVSTENAELRKKVSVYYDLELENKHDEENVGQICQ